MGSSKKGKKKQRMPGDQANLIMAKKGKAEGETDDKDEHVQAQGRTIIRMAEQLEAEQAQSQTLMSNIQKAQHQRAMAEKQKIQNCWNCGVQLTTWDHPVSLHTTAVLEKVMVTKPDGTISKVAMPAKVGGYSYACYSCNAEAQEWADGETEKVVAARKEELQALHRNWTDAKFDDLYPEPEPDLIRSNEIEGDEMEKVKAEPKTKARAPAPVVDQVADWWFAARGLLSCLMELETFQRTKKKEALEALSDEMNEEKTQNVISGEEHARLVEALTQIRNDIDEGGDGLEEATGLYGMLEGLMGRVLYHNHPLMNLDEVSVGPGAWDIIAGNAQVPVLVREGVLVIKRIQNPIEIGLEEPQQETADTEDKTDDGEG